MNQYAKVTKPAFMTDVHRYLLKELWKEGLTPSSLASDLSTMCNLSIEQALEIVNFWMWTDNIKLGR